MKTWDGEGEAPENVPVLHGRSGCSTEGADFRMGWDGTSSKPGCASCDDSDSCHFQVPDRVPLTGTGISVPMTDVSTCSHAL